MRIVFLGSPEPAIHPLKALLASDKHEVVGVISQPARPSGRKRVLTDPAVAAFAKESGLVVLQPEKARDPEFLKQFAELAPDVAVTAAYGQILTQQFLDIPKRATINIHPSLLPAYRGAIPVPATLLDGCKETGVSVLFTVKALDAGHIIAQEKTAIEDSETADVLLDRLFQQSGKLLLAAIDKLEDPEFDGTPQDESQVTHCSKIAKEDGLARWELPAETLRCQFRAYQPWPGLYTYHGAKRVGIAAVCAVSDDSEGEPGAVRFDKSRKALGVTTGSGTLWVDRVKPEGSKVMEAAGFWNGLKDRDRVRFGLQEGT